MGRRLVIVILSLAMAVGTKTILKLSSLMVEVRDPAALRFICEDTVCAASTLIPKAVQIRKGDRFSK